MKIMRRKKKISHFSQHFHIERTELAWHAMINYKLNNQNHSNILMAFTQPILQTKHIHIIFNKQTQSAAECAHKSLSSNIRIYFGMHTKNRRVKIRQTVLYAVNLRVKKSNLLLFSSKVLNFK